MKNVILTIVISICASGSLAGGSDLMTSNKNESPTPFCDLILKSQIRLSEQPLLWREHFLANAIDSCTLYPSRSSVELKLNEISSSTNEQERDNFAKMIVARLIIYRELTSNGKKSLYLTENINNPPDDLELYFEHYGYRSISFSHSLDVQEMRQYFEVSLKSEGLGNVATKENADFMSHRGEKIMYLRSLNPKSKHYMEPEVDAEGNIEFGVVGPFFTSRSMKYYLYKMILGNLN